MDSRTRHAPSKRKTHWKKANDLMPYFYENENTSTESLAITDTSGDETGTMRTSINNSMNPFPTSQQPNSRQTPSRLQNANKNGAGGWPASAYAFGGLGGAPTGFGSVGTGPGQSRPGQLSGFAQVMGGGSQQGPIDMR